MKVSLISVTPDAEKLIAYCARVSSPNQDNPEIAKLIKYCIKNAHHSILEMAHMTLEIETSIAISAQILRHKSFSFQQFSGRYSQVKDSYEEINPRRQDATNRQNSIDDLDTEVKTWFAFKQKIGWDRAYEDYEEALSKGVAKESARFMLPQGATTRMYMCGNLRSWVHYLSVRDDDGVQEEHRQVAKEAKQIFVEQFPVVSEAMGWSSI